MRSVHGRPGPVLMELAKDALGCRSRLANPAIRNNGIQTTAAPEAIDAAIARLSQAERPLIIAGGGINHTRATEEILEFAQLLDAPIVMTGFGKGSVPEDSPYSIGIFRDGVAQAAMNASDLIVAVGTPIQLSRYWQLGASRFRNRLLHIEADPEEIHKEYPAIALGYCRHRCESETGFTAVKRCASATRNGQAVGVKAYANYAANGRRWSDRGSSKRCAM